MEAMVHQVGDRKESFIKWNGEHGSVVRGTVDYQQSGGPWEGANTIQSGSNRLNWVTSRNQLILQLTQVLFQVLLTLLWGVFAPEWVLDVSWCIPGVSW